MECERCLETLRRRLQKVGDHMKTIICDICKKIIREEGVEIKKKEIKARKYYLVCGYKKAYSETTMDICEKCLNKIMAKLEGEE